MQLKKVKSTIIAAAAAIIILGTGVPALAASPGQTLTVTARSGLNVRNGQSTSSKRITCLGRGARVTCISDSGNGWIQIKTSGGITGYVSSAYVSTASHTGSYSSTSTTTSETSLPYNSSVSGQAIANYAMQFVGLRYVWGGENLTNGADCSGFTKAIYARYGVYLPHYDLSQRAYGRPIASISQAQPGDLVFYSGHVAIYIGNGQVISARNQRYGVGITSAWYMPIQAIRRIF